MLPVSDWFMIGFLLIFLAKTNLSNYVVGNKRQAYDLKWVDLESVVHVPWTHSDTSKLHCFDMFTDGFAFTVLWLTSLQWLDSLHKPRSKRKTISYSYCKVKCLLAHLPRPYVKVCTRHGEPKARCQDVYTTIHDPVLSIVSL